MQFQIPQLSLPAVPRIALNFFVSKPMLWIVLLIFLIIYSVVTSVLMYHWSTYGMNNRRILVARLLFLSVSCFLFMIAVSSIIYF